MTLPLLAIGSIASSIIGSLDELFTSTEEKEAAKIKIIEEMQKPHILQALTNLKEAEHSSWFVAGWRPAIGWICAVGLMYQFLILPFAEMISFFVGTPIDFPAIESEMLFTMTLSLLGLGGLRTFEKTKGVSREINPKGVY